MRVYNTEINFFPKGHTKNIKFPIHRQSGKASTFKKSTFQKVYIPNKARSKKSTFHKMHIPEIIFQKEHIPNREHSK